MEKSHVCHPAILWAILAAALYAISAPLSKLLLDSISPTMMAALLYLGAGIGMATIWMVRKGRKIPAGEPLTRKEFPYTLGMIVLDIAAPVLLMAGLSQTSAAGVSLLNNFEIVATSLIALCFFRERIPRRLWLAIGLITLSSILLSLNEGGALSFSPGSLLVLAACGCWGLENNCTRALSQKDTVQVVMVKGIFSGLGSLLVALLSGEIGYIPPGWILAALLLGFVAYGLSIFCYVLAQRYLGAARTSAYYAISPFIGAGLSLMIFREAPSVLFLTALAIMAVGAWLAAEMDETP